MRSEQDVVPEPVEIGGEPKMAGVRPWSSRVLADVSRSRAMGAQAGVVELR